jgi:hypothetical protein
MNERPRARTTTSGENQLSSLQMKQMASLDNDRTWAEIAELLERRSTVQRWLDRLQAQHGTVSDKILQRVREDYENRLRETLAVLGSHRDSITSQLERATTRLVEAEDQNVQAQETLEEGRLRNAIGEIDEDTWNTERGELEAAVAAARTAESSVRDETERLRDLLDQLDEKEEPGEQPAVREELRSSPSPPPEDTLAVFEPAPPPEPKPREITISAPAQSEPVFSEVTADEQDDRILVSDELPSEETAPKPGLKCPECGYTNDLSAWFCGVCGADIG